MSRNIVSDDESRRLLILQKSFAEHPLAQRLIPLCSAHSLTPHLFGGAIRDTLLENGSIRDYDLLLEGKEEDFRGVLDALNFNEDYAQSHKPIDLHHTSNVDEALQKVDLTVNAIALNLDTGALLSAHERVIADLRNRNARPTNSTLFVYNPPAALRSLRLAYQHELKISEELKNTLLTFPQCVRLGEERYRSLVFAELATLLSHTSAPQAIAALVEFGLLQQVLPEVVPALRDFSKKKTLFDKLIEISLSFPPAVQNELHSVEQHHLFEETPPTGERALLGFNEMGLMRFCCLFDGLSESYLSLDGAASSPPQSYQFRSRAMNNFLNSAQARVQLSISAMALLEEVKGILLSTIRLLEEGNLDQELSEHTRPHCFLIFLLAKISAQTQHAKLEQEVRNALATIDVE